MQKSIKASQKIKTCTNGKKSYKKIILLSAGIGLVSLSATGYAAENKTCEDLVKSGFPDAKIISVQTIEAGKFKIPDSPGPMVELQKLSGINAEGQAQLGPNPAFCRVKANMKPAINSDINIEVWLPLKEWNGKLLSAGNFSWGGYFMYPVMMSGLEKGYATASTDTGHDDDNPEQTGGKFIPGHPEKLIDYAYRAHHLMAVNAKEIIRSFYGRLPDKSYWLGCSLGGIEGLIEAQNYPEDYDGMVIGAPPNPLLNFNAAQLWPMWLINQNPAMKMSKEKFELVHNAVLKQCATPTGQKQGFVEEPDKCTFEPKQLLCKAEDNNNCLTKDQIAFMENMYRGPVNPRTGEVIFKGPAKGSELEFMSFAQSPNKRALDLFKYAVYEDENWDWRTLDWDKGIEFAKNKLNGKLRAGTDLKGFFDRGGKMIMFIGWNDYHNPLDLIDYYKQMLKTSVPSSADPARLFISPGMAHCQGGDGCDTFNKIGALDKWVEQGIAPERLDASRVVDGKIVRTRPLCAWPKVAVYSGQGNENEAASYKCVN
ncbi:tannase/feruloyl esterase family alpha/beta hydrolase [Brenneria roseae subsp. roseae]|uniref:tannase/feruloyl esterase family alpha/beta hydrolase n=1 Tax=Brenneria roseae TaxID=1509241 RepID=UPI000D611BEB|nr:tannase/feruloyl esterase family alpha/beta hydrolase [Brenneria roseae]PWC23081.1 tannase/feruloyl esterase family alpha/beta hydrolase [Brenneria roseae subsp. roseae]